MTAPQTKHGTRRTSAVAFLGAVRVEMRRAGLSASDLAQDIGRSTETVRDGVQRRIREWPFYRRVLNACGADRSTVEHLHNAWRQWDTAKRAGGSRPANVVPMSRFVPEAREVEPRAIPVATSELEASTPAAFIALLRRVQVRSGLTPAEVSVRAGIPRSTAYRFVNDQKNTSLPTKMEQVRAFVAACGLPEPQVERVVVLWCELQGGGVPADAPTGAPADPPVDDPVVVVDRFAPDPPVVPEQRVIEIDSARHVREVVVPLLTSVARPLLAMACVLVATALTAGLVIAFSAWPAFTQLLAVLGMALLYAMIATGWCVGAGLRDDAEPRPRPSADGGLAFEDVVAAPAVIGLDGWGEPCP
ncbi:helix-turn-helix domain-containing protein [Saccharothrix sp. HUAS TT1]|uniref:helix-turn-helix domain-containing protein n=1 Tax=unclassified Saccharothrix TaxID=2593673 RepID=UPI00345BF06D